MLSLAFLSSLPLTVLIAFWLPHCRALSGVQSRSARRAQSRGEGCISGVYFCLAATRALATRKKETKQDVVLSPLISKKRRRSHGFSCGLCCFCRLTVSAQHSLALPETHRNTTALHLPVDLSSFFFPTQPHSPQRLALRLSKPRDLARGKDIALQQHK